MISTATDEHPAKDSETRSRFRRHGHRLKDKRIRWRKRLPVIALIPVMFGLSFIASLVPGFVEVVYSRSIYQAIATGLGTLTGWIPLSLAEVSLIILFFWLVMRAARSIADVLSHLRTPKNIFKRLAVRVLTWTAVIYTAFLWMWGFNYHREPLAGSIGLEMIPPSTQELRELNDSLIARVNRDRGLVRNDKQGRMTLTGQRHEGFERAYKGFEELANDHEVFEGSFGYAKPVIFSSLMSVFGISGIYIPFTGEANINGTCPDSIWPFLVCHETAHQYGFAREDEANYIAWLACSQHPDSDFRYSGSLMAMLYAMSRLQQTDKSAYEKLDAKISDQVREDIHAIDEWRSAYQSVVSEASSKVNDAYLKSNGQDDGVQSYGRMVDLLMAERRARKKGWGRDFQ